MQIFPSNTKNFSWLPKGAGVKGEKIGVDAISTADLRKLAQPFGGPPEGIVEVDVIDEGEEGGEEKICPKCGVPCSECPCNTSDEISDEEAIEDVDEEAAEENLDDDMQSKVEKLEADVQQVADDVKEIVLEIGEDGELEISDELAEPVDVEVDLDIPDGEDLESETSPMEEEDEMDVEINSCTASNTGSLVKIAKLSKENKSALRKYWVNMLGFPADYVEAMLKD